MNKMKEIFHSKLVQKRANSLREEMVEKHIKVSNYPTEAISNSGPEKIIKPNTYYYLNSVVDVIPNRDVFYKSNSICEIYVNWKNEEVHTEECNGHIGTKLKKQYAFSARTCEAPYTKASMRYPHNFIFVFDNKENAENHLEWFNKCFLTIQEQEKIAEERTAQERKFYKIRQIQLELKKYKNIKPGEKK